MKLDWNAGHNHGSRDLPRHGTFWNTKVVNFTGGKIDDA